MAKPENPLPCAPRMRHHTAMIFARLFYALYLGILFLLLAIQFARLLFGRETLKYKIIRFVYGVAICLIWPLAILAPEPRRHLLNLFAFIRGKQETLIIDIKKKDYRNE